MVKIVLASGVVIYFLGLAFLNWKQERKLRQVPKRDANSE